MLIIKNLHASVEDKEILKGINLEVKAGEVHAIMGPNGAGKSTLSSVIAGNENFEVTEGDILLQGESLLEDAPEERAHKGIFMSFQYTRYACCRAPQKNTRKSCFIRNQS